MPGRYYDYPHFTDQENEARIHLITCPRALSKQGDGDGQQLSSYSLTTAKMEEETGVF